MDDDEEKVGEDAFKMGGADDDELLDMPEGIADFGLDEEDPDRDS